MFSPNENSGIRAKKKKKKNTSSNLTLSQGTQY